ncbi:hypothetical protein [Loktanella sp. Alg231-35]|uniref:hypothetical protein n=1 Tax=Loktanella sp. Alg231-35 TaxID=1922220 RepID=UPI000D562453|nr:hypothetical protein [Loktanella sp. Alg231-35]
MLRLLTTTAVIAAITVPAAAQQLTYGNVEFEISRLDADGDEITSKVLESDVEFSANQFLFGAEVKNQSLELGGSDATITNYNAFGAYRVVPEFMIGAGLNGIDLDGSDVNGYEVFAQYTTPQFGVAVNYNNPDSDDDDFTLTTGYIEGQIATTVTLGAVIESFNDVDNKYYALTAEYDDGPIFARAYYNAITDVDGGLFGVRGAYGVTDTVDVIASLERGSEDFFGDLTAYSIGADYMISEGFSVDGSIGQLEFESSSAQFVQLGVTYEVGERMRLDRKVNDALREDRSKGIGSLFVDIGIGAGFGFF